jgi:hypothetical protein
MESNLEQPSIIAESLDTPTRTGDRWLFRWRLQNQTTTPLRLLSVRVPHGKFKAEERIFAPVLEVAADESRDFQIPILCNEAPESIIDNAFLILAVEWRDQQWRFFIRLQVKINRSGVPETSIVSITIQRAGFSGLKTESTNDA